MLLEVFACAWGPSYRGQDVMASKIDMKSDDRRCRRKEALPQIAGGFVFVSMGGSVHEKLAYGPRWKWRADNLAVTYSWSMACKAL